MVKHYVFFIRDVLPKPEAHLVQATNSANAASNLGYSTVLFYLQKSHNALNPINWIYPIRLRSPSPKLAKFYNLQSNLKVVSLATPWPIDRLRGNKFANSSTIVSKYYFPLHIRPIAQIVHTRDWNFVKAAIQNGIPAIYEHHHHDRKKFEPEIVQHPLFQISVTVADTIRDSMIQNGMPPDKVIKLHNGFNQLFLMRHLDNAQQWRQKLLGDRQYLVVYSGALYRFKGINLLLDVAKEMPHVQFALAGGPHTQVLTYQSLCHQKQINNVKLLGFVPQNELSSLLQAADALAHPHCSGEAATFTSPLKLFDYMASGTPIVSTEIPPLQEFKSSDAIAGWCEPDSAEQFSQCLQAVLDTYPRKRGGYPQGPTFVQQFSWENRIKTILNYVDEVHRPIPT
ncbi:MAG: glycosyltransferase [Elainellaceae cyanobacterium]